MKTAALFDVDGTLTPPRQPITKFMVNILGQLSVPFSVAAGSDLTLLETQFFDPMFQHGYRKQFHAFVSNGAIHYHCDFTENKNITLVKSFNIKHHLGDKDYDFLIKTLENARTNPDFALPKNLTICGDTIVYRESMVNFAPIGRLKIEGPEAQKNRRNFVDFDTSTNYRLNLLNFLNHELNDLIDEKGLKITLGGQTSFDVGIRGKDKTNAVTSLFEMGFDRVVFFGDALFEGGNDYVIKEFEMSWPSDSSQKIEAIKVESFENTIEKLRDFNFLETK